MNALFSISDLHHSKFLDCPNRFIPNNHYNNAKTQAHIHDPGRLNELHMYNFHLLMVSGTKKPP